MSSSLSLSSSLSSSSNALQITDMKAEAINVVVRCRGRTDLEIALKSDIVVDVPDKTGSNQVSINSSDDNSIVGKMACKTFTVDQAFGPSADQELLFNSVAAPMFDEFLKGFNCTIFAYGQTGTGKTYTMCGDDGVLNGSYSPDAGIIPRILFKLFSTLESADPSNDFLIKCSLVEIYNETLKDLLNPKGNKKDLKIYEEQIKTVPGKPDKSAVFIKDLEELCVSNAVEGLNLLRKGLIDRKTSSTNMNKNSSRSHTIFSISLYKKDGQNDAYRFSKMNLVDLAGSENISRSGATDLQAKEAGSINKSLLSLGKVINALVDNHLPPYRDSKLTRLLKDSLGGETKTVLILNISPSQMDSEETSKTLEYASKLKNVMNTPQVGNMMLRHVVVKDLVDEVTKLRKDLMLSWSKDGVMLDRTNYDQLKKDAQQYKLQVEEVNRKLEFQQNQNKILNHDLNSKMQEVSQLKEKLKEMQQVNNILSGKVQKQQNSERMMYESTKKYRELIDLFNSGVKDFESHQKSTSSFIKNLIYDSLQEQIEKLVTIAEQDAAANVNIKDHCDKIKTQLSSMVETFQESAFEICDNATNSLTAKLPLFFEDLKKTISKLNNESKQEVEEFEANLHGLELNNLQFDRYLTQNLFNNHDDLLARHLDGIKAQNEANKKEFIAGFIKLFDNHYSKTAAQLPQQIADLRQQIVDSEKDLLSGKKYDWLTAGSNGVQRNEQLIRRLSSRIDQNSDTLSDRIDDLNNATTNSKVILQDERTKVVQMIEKMKSENTIDQELVTIARKFRDQISLKQDTLQHTLNVVEKLSCTSEAIGEKLRKEDFVIPELEKMAQLMETLNGNDKIIESQIVCARSRTTSPVRQLTPRRGGPMTVNSSRQASPLRSMTWARSRPGSRTSSRLSSRSTSPEKTTNSQTPVLPTVPALTPLTFEDGNKENFLKRKATINSTSNEPSRPIQTQNSKRFKPFPLNARSKLKNPSGSMIPRKPFR